ncbi:MAG: 50S ribosomal protein L18 [Patescibacteria group bacterium]
MLRESRIKRQKRIRSKMHGTKSMPRLSVYRSNKYIYAQAIDDEKNETIASISEKDLKDKAGTKTQRAKNLGILLGERLKKSKTEKIVFDKGSFRYHGRVKAFAEGLREGGIIF